MSQLLYGITVWGGSPNKCLDRLIVLQKKAIRHVSNVKYNSHTNPLFYQLKCLKLRDAYRLNCCKMAYKRKLNTLPLYHASKLQFNHEIRQSSTRQDDLIALIKPSPFLKVNAFNHKVGDAWNNIPNFIKGNLKYKKRSEKYFASKIKNNLLKNYNTICSEVNCYICNRPT